MIFFLVVDFGVKVCAESRDKIYDALGFSSQEDMIEHNGGVMPDIYEISLDDYEEDDGFDVY